MDRTRQVIDGITFDLVRPHDFGWVSKWGKVIRVFDHQDSGNICFVTEGERRYFLKYAGANTVDYPGEASDAVQRLRVAVSAFDVLRHKHLVSLIEHCEIGQGYLAVFDWFDGEGIRPDSIFKQFRQQSVDIRLGVLDRIFEFHEHVESKGYVAIDFYLGSLIYNFTDDILKICDIDLYEKRPYTNTMGRMWGSSKLMSPEEFTLGAEIDQITNVFTMGAMAFALVGGMLERSLKLWEAGSDLHRVAERAVRPSRAERYASVREFCREWKSARGVGA